WRRTNWSGCRSSASAAIPTRPPAPAPTWPTCAPSRGAKNATVTNQVPFVNSSWNSGVRVTPDQQQATLVATSYLVEEGFMDTFGLDLVAGRHFNPDEFVDYEDYNQADPRPAIPAVIITRKMAER